MRVLLIVLTVALSSLVSAPVQAQTTANDQYGSSGVGYDAATDAIRASNAFDDASATEAGNVEEGVAFAAGSESASSAPVAAADESREAEAAGSEEGPQIDSLPSTGGTSPLLLGILLVGSGVLCLRALTR